MLMKQSPRPLTILTVEGIGLFDEFIGKCQIIEEAWENDMERLTHFYQACDIFLMPSTAEAFGMMAIEAMACGKPVVFFKGTSLDEVTFAPRAGIGATMHDTDSLAEVILDLIHDTTKREKMGQEARKLAEEHYDLNVYLSRMNELYKKLHYENMNKKNQAIAA